MTSQNQKLEACIAKSKSNIDVAVSKIEEFVASIAKAERELSNILGVEKEVVESIYRVDRAIAVLSREMQKNPASFALMDVTRADALVQFLSAVINVTGFNTRDKDSRVTLVQTESESEMISDVVDDGSATIEYEEFL